MDSELFLRWWFSVVFYIHGFPASCTTLTCGLWLSIVHIQGVRSKFLRSTKLDAMSSAHAPQLPPDNWLQLTSNLWYKTRLNWQWNCWSLRCSWSIACRRCSNYIFILDLTHGFNIMNKGKCKTRRDTFKFWDLVHLILEIWWYCSMHTTKLQTLAPEVSI